jgi:hypothetical protein
LGLPELGQVESGDLFGLLDLLLVSADLKIYFSKLFKKYICFEFKLFLPSKIIE